MTTFGALLAAKKDAILAKWLDLALASYSEDAARAFARQKDRFANPVGASLREGTPEIFDAVAGEADVGDEAVEAIRPALEKIIKIRAVQQFTASEALGFVFQLKEAIRAELTPKAKDAPAASDLAKLDARIDRVALAAFDVYVECRQQVNELRIADVKRNVAWILDKVRRRGADPELAKVELE